MNDFRNLGIDGYRGDDFRELFQFAQGVNDVGMVVTLVCFSAFVVRRYPLRKSRTSISNVPRTKQKASESM